MKNFTMLILMGVMMHSHNLNAQKVSEKIDELTYAWDREAERLSVYSGLVEFCVNEEYRYATIALLRDIHHYDSLLYKKLLKLNRVSHNREVSKTLKDIEEFEEEYTTENFIHFLHEDCRRVKYLETHGDDLRKDSGEGSYDNRVYIMEVELNRYVHHITKKIDQIRKHVHELYD